jgi:hypothetical protein
MDHIKYRYGDTHARPTVVLGTRVRDQVCGEIHTLTRPPGAEQRSDALLVYTCAARGPEGRFSSIYETTHVGAILSQLVDGLEPVMA